MKTIKELLDIVIALESNSQISKAIDFHKGVPTLENGNYRKLSPMLKVENIKSLDPLLYSHLTHQKYIRIK